MISGEYFRHKAEMDRHLALAQRPRRFWELPSHCERESRWHFEMAKVESRAAIQSLDTDYSTKSAA